MVSRRPCRRILERSFLPGAGIWDSRKGGFLRDAHRGWGVARAAVADRCGGDPSARGDLCAVAMRQSLCGARVVRGADGLRLAGCGWALQRPVCGMRLPAFGMECWGGFAMVCCRGDPGAGRRMAAMVLNQGASRSEVCCPGDRGARRRMVWSWAAKILSWGARALSRGARRSELWCRGDWDAPRRMVSYPVSMVSNRGVG